MKVDAGHVEQAARVLGVDGGALDLVVLPLQVGNHVEGLGAVGVEALDEVGVDLDLLQLVAVGEVLVALEAVIHAGKPLHEHLALAVPLGLRGGRRGRGGTASGHAGGHGCVRRCHCTASKRMERAWIVLHETGASVQRPRQCREAQMHRRGDRQSMPVLVNQSGGDSSCGQRERGRREREREIPCAPARIGSEAWGRAPVGVAATVGTAARQPAGEKRVFLVRGQGG